MRNTMNNNSTTGMVDSGFGNWKSPIPYLFSGLALMLGLIAIALVFLSCSYLKPSAGSEDDDTEEKPAKQVNVEADSDHNEPKIVVIMAGDDNPTYLAKPVSSKLVSYSLARPDRIRDHDIAA